MPLLSDERLFKLLDNSVPPIIRGISAFSNISVVREGNFVDDKFGDGCGKACLWNGGGYYNEFFFCGQDYPSGATFYCSQECYCSLGSTTRVFISYSRHDKDLVDRMARALERNGITFLRDINNLGAFDDFHAFMNEAGAARFFVAVISESYAKSRYCMYELLQAMHSNLNIRLVPLLMDQNFVNANVADFVDYWEKQAEEVRRALSGLGTLGTSSLYEQLAMIEDIVNGLQEVRTELLKVDLPKADALIRDDFRGTVTMILRTVAGHAALPVGGQQPVSSEDTLTAKPSTTSIVQAQDQIAVLVSALDGGTATHLIASEVRTALLPFFAVFDNDQKGFQAFLESSPDSSHRFFLCILDEAFLRSLAHAWQAITVNSGHRANIVPLFTSPEMFQALSEVPYIAWWQAEVLRLHGESRELAAEVRDHIGAFIAEQRKKVVPDLGHLRESHYDDVVQAILNWQSDRC